MEMTGNAGTSGDTTKEAGLAGVCGSGPGDRVRDLRNRKPPPTTAATRTNARRVREVFMVRSFEFGPAKSIQKGWGNL